MWSTGSALEIAAILPPEGARLPSSPTSTQDKGRLGIIDSQQKVSKLLAFSQVVRKDGKQEDSTSLQAGLERE